MPDRLASLTRQRQLIEEHLQWLDSEIANEIPEGAQIPTAPSVGRPTPIHSAIVEPTPNAVAAIETEAVAEDVDALTDQLISQYAHVSTRREMDPRLGLVLFFGGMLGLIGIVVFLFYWFGYR